MTIRLIFVPILLALLATASYAALSGTVPLRSGSRSSVTPPGYIVGTPGPDRLVGTRGDDVIMGLGGNDRLDGKQGADVLNGGAGSDVLIGGPGGDVLRGGPGNDRIYARDGRRDWVYGGPGSDEAWVDRVDVVAGVERVHRS